MTLFRCPCLVCPTCSRPQAPRPHPVATGAARCDVCGHEWEVPRGPGLTDRHPCDRHELDAWRQYDNRRALARLAAAAAPRFTRRRSSR